MGNSLEQYRAAVGTHDIFVSSRNYKMCMKGKFWNTPLFLFYLEAIYLQTLKVVVHNYNLMRFNRLWLTQIYLYQFYIPDLILLANDVEVNPGPDTENTIAVNSFLFYGPWNSACQAIWCSDLELPLMVMHKKDNKMAKPLEKPSKLYKIIGDGNCFFRALSYAVTGRQNYHNIVRAKIIQHMRQNENALLAYMNSSVDEYLARTEMANLGVWGTDVEIITAASLLKTDIYVYTKVGSLYKWQRFPSSIMSGYPAKYGGGIYLQNTSGVHYDLVLDVSPKLNSNLCHERNGNNQGSNHRTKKGEHCNQSPEVKKVSDNATDSSNSNKIVCAKSMKKLVKQTFSVENADSKKKQTHLSNFHNAIQYKMYHCQICFEAWPVKGKNKSKQTNCICQRCTSDKKSPKKFSSQNQMIPSSIPIELQDLTQIKEMLIARALPIMNVYVKPGGQRGFSGHCINLPQQLSELAQSLPRHPRHVSLLLVTMKGKDNACQDDVVRRGKVQQALNWLIQNNPYYKTVILDLDSLNSLPLNGVPDDLQTVETNESDFQNNVTNSNVSDVDEDQVINDDTNTSSFLPHNDNSKLEKDAILSEIGIAKTNWPSVGDAPLNEYSISGLATLAFPTLFPDGKGDPTNPCLRRGIPFIERIKHLLKLAEIKNGRFHFRFASHPRFSYWALNMIQREEQCNKQLFFSIKIREKRF